MVVLLDPVRVDHQQLVLETIEQLYKVVDLDRAGRVVPEIERFTLDTALEAYRRLRDGPLDARAVLVPHG